MRRIWRYMPFWKFESLLAEQAIYFSTLASQKDELEGTYPLYESMIREEGIKARLKDNFQAGLNNDKVVMSELKKRVGVSCWHINEYENLRMWTEYVKDDSTGLAITSTEELFKASFVAFSHQAHLDIQAIKYVDYNYGLKDKSFSPNYLFFHKNTSFDWELELRALLNLTFQPLPHHSNYPWNIRKVHDNSYDLQGFYVPAHIETLIEQIVMSPNVPESFERSLIEICREYGLNKTIKHSAFRV